MPTHGPYKHHATDRSPDAMASVPPVPPTSAFVPAENRPESEASPSLSSSSPPETLPRSHSQTDQSAPSSAQIARLPADEESALVDESNVLKQSGTASFTKSDFSSAISLYDQALASLPNYLDYELAVLKSNISACHLKLNDWKAAIDAATAALECLEHVLPSPKAPKATRSGEDQTAEAEADTDTVVELDDDGDDSLATQLKELEISDQRRTDVLRIRSKSLLRRAKARSNLSSWSELAGAEEDYKVLLAPPLFPALPLSDKRVVQEAMRDLPGKVKEAREKEVGEMMGKLKDLGNTVLKPFGLSTDMFKFQQQEGGGYSMSMDSGGSADK